MCICVHIADGIRAVLVRACVRARAGVSVYLCARAFVLHFTVVLEFARISMQFIKEGANPKVYQAAGSTSVLPFLRWPACELVLAIPKCQSGGESAP